MAVLTGRRPRVAGLPRRARLAVARLPLRARVALVAAVALSVVAVLLVVAPGRDDSGGRDGAGGADTATGEGTPVPGHGNTATTFATGGIEIDAPEGWLELPVPDLGFGIAVPPGWEATVLSADGLSALARAAPAVPDFVDNAHAAARGGGLVYAAGVDAAGRVSDVLVRAAPETGVTDLAGLEGYARELAAQAGRTDPQVEAVAGAQRPTLRLRFSIGGDGEVARGTETLVLGPDGIVWSVVVTSDDAAVHDDLAAGIAATLAFAPA